MKARRQKTVTGRRVRIVLFIALPLALLAGCGWFIDDDEPGWIDSYAPALVVTVDQVTMTIEVTDFGGLRSVQVLLDGVRREVFEPDRSAATLTHSLDDVRPGAYELAVIATDRDRNETAWSAPWESPTHLTARAVLGSAGEAISHEVDPGRTVTVARVEIETSANVYTPRFDAPPRPADGYEHRWRVENPTRNNLAGVELELTARDAGGGVLWSAAPAVGDLRFEGLVESGVVDESPVAVAALDLVFRGYVARRVTLTSDATTVEHEQSAGVFVDVVDVLAWQTARIYSPIAATPSRDADGHAHEFEVVNRYGGPLAGVAVGVTARDGLGNEIWSGTANASALAPDETLFSGVRSGAPTVPAEYEISFQGYAPLRSLLDEYRETVFDGTTAIGAVVASHTALTYTPLAGSLARPADSHRHDLRFDYTWNRELADLSVAVRARAGATTVWSEEITRARISPLTSVVAEAVGTSPVSPDAFDVTVEAYERFPETNLNYDYEEFNWSSGLVTLSLEVWHRATTFAPVADAPARAPEDHEHYYRITNLSPFTLSGANTRVRAYYRGSFYWQHSMNIATFAPGAEVVSPVVSSVDDSPYDYQIWLTWTGLSGANQ